MLNIDTFKSLCMLAKTDKGKEIRRYYVKLENIHNKIKTSKITRPVFPDSSRVKSEDITGLLLQNQTTIIAEPPICFANDRCMLYETVYSRCRIDPPLNCASRGYYITNSRFRINNRLSCCS